MTRSDLVARLAERFAQLTQRDTEFAVKAILDAMSDALARGLAATGPYFIEVKTSLKAILPRRGD